MDLNSLIYNRLAQDEELSSLLAVFGDKPAVFADEVPSDQDNSWEGKIQYPRICYKVDIKADKERRTAGEMHVAIHTTKENLVIEQIETAIRRSLKDVLMKPSDQAPFCVSWSKSDAFILEGMGILGKDIIFDILEYPSQQTTDPDPVIALALMLKELFPDSIVLNVDRVDNYTDPADKPVFYVKLQSLAKTNGHCEHSIAWFQAKMSVHILYPVQEDRLRMSAAINQKLRIDEEVIMLDMSPMTVEQLTMNNMADYLREGQIAVTGKYGCLRRGEKKKKITDIRLQPNWRGV